MRFMMLMIPGIREGTAGAMPDAKAVAAMMKYNEALQKPACCSRSMASTRRPWARASRLRREAKVTDGPFAEAKGVLGGYWMIQVKSKEEAVEWASRCPASTTK